MPFLPILGSVSSPVLLSLLQHSICRWCWLCHNSPISSQYYSVTVAESLPVGTVLLEIQATDGDEPATGSSYIIYQVKEGDPDNTFIIETDPETNRGFLKINKVNRWIYSSPIYVYTWLLALLLPLSLTEQEIFMYHMWKMALLEWQAAAMVVGCHETDLPPYWWSRMLVAFATKHRWNWLVSAQDRLFLQRQTLPVAKTRSVCAEVADKSHMPSVGIRNTRKVFHWIQAFQ